MTQLAREKLAGGLDAFGRQNMTEARIEFRLDLETCSSQPFRCELSSCAGMTGSFSPCITEYLGEGLNPASGAVASRPEAATTARTGQRPVATASSAMMAPCEKPKNAMRSSFPANPCFSISLETTR